MFSTFEDFSKLRSSTLKNQQISNTFGENFFNINDIIYVYYVSLGNKVVCVTSRSAVFIYFTFDLLSTVGMYTSTPKVAK